ncbi:DUF3617 domain-containing protein [Erythrobacter crassostreae]|uniref:DUF3617 domain-containing protein n=1 Tax=Erythrobacter crassostreae TaxID=2828328 RepID=A0A9X1F087_9SPHN|nr:DUF3617 domain-containing protein [Erythrobacter crassostrea]MBV7257956.1 DUF3617 domain-containing protein [Erythrobacter crassostrea]
MQKTAITIAALIGLSACSQGPAEDEILPGNWKMSAGMTEVQVPGATEEQAAMFKEMAGQMSSQEQCVAEDETKLDPDELTQVFAQAGECEVGEFDFSDGKIAGSLTCSIGGSTSEIAITGTVSPESFMMSAATEVLEDNFPEGKANVTMVVKGERIGDC